MFPHAVLGAMMLAEQQERARPALRQPSNLQGLLRFALEATRNEDAPNAGPMVPMDEERRQFLEEAVNSLSVNITKELQNGINLLSDKQLIRSLSIEKHIPREVMEQFYNLEDHVSNIDNAIGFYKLGGYSVFPVCLSSEHPTIRSAACNLLGELCQSNPFCQAKVLECGYLHTLMNMINNEQEPETLSKALYGISCIIRHYEPCTAAFFENDGYGLLNRIFQTPNPDLHNKAAFLINVIYPDNKDMGEKMVSTGLLKSLISALPKTYHPLCDQIFRTLSTIIAYNDPIFINEIKNPEYNLRKYVMQYNENEYNCGMDYFEEKAYCESILAILEDQAESPISGSDDSTSYLDR